MKRKRIAVLALLSLTVAQAMELGGNFWNLGWHKSADCFENFKNVTGDNPWNPQFLKEIAIYRSLRFMDWDNTNGSTRGKWSERPAKSAPTQNPVAYEWMIDLCNRNNSDMWVTIPHLTITRATGDEPCDYALRLCILVKTGVDMRDKDLMRLAADLHTLTAEDFIAAGGVRTCEPLRADRKLYVEYSNETWNGMFRQSHYCCDEGEALKLDPKNRWAAGFRFHAWAALRLFRAAERVFGTDSPRLVKVLATQSSNSWIAGQHLQVMNDEKLNPWKIKASAIAIAPYFGHKVQGDASDAVGLLRREIQQAGAQAEEHHKLAENAGLKLIAYEGGQHVTTNAKAVNRDPEMFTLYQEYLRAMSRHISHFCHYAHVGQAGDGGAWGSLEHTGQPPADAPKYRALLEWSQQR
jgi:hypothetical protein